MNISTAIFVKSVVAADPILDDGTPQIAFIGRSNVGKSSIINRLTHQKDLARTSALPGRTQQLNIFLINKSHYLIDLPGYGYAKASWEGQQELHRLINWYLLSSPYNQTLIVLIIDANIGPTDRDMQMLRSLENQKKNIIVVANKIDKIKKSDYQKQLQKIQLAIGRYKIVPFSVKKNIGVSELNQEILDMK